MHARREDLSPGVQRLPGEPGNPGFLALGAHLRGNPLGSRVGKADERGELALEASGFPRNLLRRPELRRESTHTNVRRAFFLSLRCVSNAKSILASGLIY